MLRTFFFSIGTFVILSGMSLFAIDGVVVRVGEGAQGSHLVQAVSQPTKDGRRFIDPPDWVGYTMVGIGGITLLYSVALPRS
ncbi:MAG: hypothetical protein R3C01_10760 [Planctomycetaceae bacterium]